MTRPKTAGERLLQMLRQAVGYEITFGDETRTP